MQAVEESSSYNTYDLLSIEKLDEVTWPCALRLYLERSNSPARFTGDYYSLPVEKRVEILSQLTRHFHGEFLAEGCSYLENILLEFRLQ